MIDAGVAEFENHVNTDRYDPIYPIDEIVTFIYLAMRSAEKGTPHL